MEKSVTLEEALVVVRRLSPVDKARLIEQIVPDLERELKAVQPVPRKSLRGLWRGLDLTAQEIDQARREMWGNFPREDI
jgi:hypothetical protein